MKRAARELPEEIKSIEGSETRVTVGKNEEKEKEDRKGKLGLTNKLEVIELTFSIMKTISNKTSELRDE